VPRFATERFISDDEAGGHVGEPQERFGGKLFGRGARRAGVEDGGFGGGSAGGEVCRAEDEQGDRHREDP
jgi:hypothetical protein